MDGTLPRRLFELGLVEATHQTWTNNTLPNTHIDGSIPIDGLYHSQELEPSTMQLSFHEGVGDHRTLIVDVTTRSLIGMDKFKIIRPTARRLVSTNLASFCDTPNMSSANSPIADYTINCAMCQNGCIQTAMMKTHGRSWRTSTNKQQKFNLRERSSVGIFSGANYHSVCQYHTGSTKNGHIPL